MMGLDYPALSVGDKIKWTCQLVSEFGVVFCD